MTDAPRKYRTRVVAQRRISSTGYELSLDRNGLPFQAGRLVTLHGSDPTEDRSYSICSGEADEDLVLLYCLIPTGTLTPKLARLRAGDEVTLSGPYGEFVVRDPQRPLVFVATGTGVAPCRSYIRTYPGLRLTLVHGVRREEDLFYRDELARFDYHPCVSQEDHGGFKGRVTACCGALTFDPDSHFYLCGSNEMIFEVHELLRDRGVNEACIFTEAYYYRYDA